MAINKQQIADILKKVVCTQCLVNESVVVDSADFKEDLDADSLDLVELVMALEEEFDIEIPDDDAEEFKTVGNVRAYLEKRLLPEAKVRA